MFVVVREAKLVLYGLEEQCGVLLIRRIAFAQFESIIYR
jgi:hypothetical protein